MLSLCSPHLSGFASANLRTEWDMGNKMMAIKNEKSHFIEINQEIVRLSGKRLLSSLCKLYSKEHSYYISFYNSLKINRIRIVTEWRSNRV